jgi:23S rRNA pseudouridine1911/1915/1917 synthase
MTRPISKVAVREFIVSDRTARQRLDQYLIRHGIPRSRTSLQRLIREGSVRVNGHPAKPSYSVQAGDRIRVEMPAPTPLEIRPEPIPLDILYEDPYLLVVNKPAGLVVHPAPGHYTGTLVNALLYHCRDLSGIGGRERPGIVHRLDKGTSGLLLVAKTDEAHRGLSSQFASHSIARTYQALVWGRLKKGTSRVSLAIGRDRRERKKISPRTIRPREAVTVFRVLERFAEATLVEAEPKTGRTHQIRVHLTSLGHPVLGDRVYGGRKVGSLGEIRIERPMLHARRLGFIHPASGKLLEFETPLPEDMEMLLRLLQRRGQI